MDEGLDWCGRVRALHVLALLRGRRHLAGVVVKKYIVTMIHEEITKVEVEADYPEQAHRRALKGEYDNWEITDTRRREVLSIEEVFEQ